EEVHGFAREQADQEFHKLKMDQAREQAEADFWWTDLVNGVRPVVEEALKAAFADNQARAEVISAEKEDAHLLVYIPSINVFPEKRANITPTGRLSSKAWSKSEL